MRIILFVLFVMVSVMYAYGDYTDLPCSVGVESFVYPVTYQGYQRINPDNSAYPGDGVHYLFKYTASNTCWSFTINPIISEGAFNITTHNQATGHTTTEFPHYDEDLKLKRLRTDHYTEILDIIEHCTYKKGGGKLCYTEYVLADIPIASLRQDKQDDITYAQACEIFERVKVGKGNWRCEGNKRDNIYLHSTVSWGLADIGIDHTHPKELHPYEDDTTIRSFERMIHKQCTGLYGNMGCIYGHAEIDTAVTTQKCLIAELKKANIPHYTTTYVTPQGSGETVLGIHEIKDECVMIHDDITLTVRGVARICEGNVCEYPVRTDTSSLRVNVLSSTHDVLFENPQIIDWDGYVSGNLDSTYYVWDTPAILVTPDMPFRDVRAPHISFDVIRLDTPISEVFTDSCHVSSCMINATGSRITETQIGAINGDRLDVMMAGSLAKLGEHKFPYRVTMYNIERVVGVNDGTTVLFIADYSPVFGTVPFAYVMMGSDGMTSFEKLHGVAMAYVGSNGTGNDDDGAIHSDRRSKINDFDAEISASTLNIHRTLHTTLFMVGSDDITDVVSSVFDSVLDTSGKDSLGTYDKALLSINDTAVFTNDGFGRIAFSFEGVNDEIDLLKVSNVTMRNKILSSDFGGYNVTTLAEYSYNYPGSYVSSVLNVTAITFDGTVDDIPIHATLYPVISNNTMHLAEYMAYHIRNLQSEDTSGFITEPYVDMYLGDMHDVSNVASGVGHVTSVINLAAVSILHETWGALGIDENNFTSLGEEFAYSSPVIYHLNITANDITNVFEYYPYGFSRPLNHTISMDDGYTLEHTEYLSSIHVRSPDTFGEIEKLTVNDVPYGGKCVHQCFLGIDGDTRIVAENIWGGTAYVNVTPQVWNSTGNVILSHVNHAGPMVILLLGVIAVVFLCGRVFGK